MYSHSPPHCNTCRVVPYTLHLRPYIYIILEFDIIGDFIEKLNTIIKKYLIINFDNLFDIYLDGKSSKNLNNKKFYNDDTMDYTIYKNFIENYNLSYIQNFLKHITIKDDMRSIFNKLNLTLKSLKRQTDNFINLSFKLGELIKTQEKPIKYINNILILFKI